MPGSDRVRAVLLACSALAATLFVLDSAGVAAPLGRASLRGERRLQQSQLLGADAAGAAGAAGMQAAQQGAQYGSEAVGQVHQGVQAGVRQGAQYGGEALQRGAQYGGQLANHVASNPYQTVNQGLKYSPQSMLDSYLPSKYRFLLLVAQVIFAAFYYCTTVFNYPKWMGPSPMSCQLQAEPAPVSLTNTSPTNCCLSYLCPQARAAHTFDRTGVLDYWCGVLAMFFCPFCTLCWANSCTDLNPKLGGEPANLLASGLCTWLCSCCVIAQDAESLDAATGAKTEICGHSGGGMPGVSPYGGPMGHPGMMQQQMMYPRY